MALPESSIRSTGRLEVSGGLTECWNTLMELKSCSNENVILFLNSQADIGPDYCRAIDIITRNCWPAMLTSLEFTAKEGNILRGYYDASSAPSPGGLAVIYQPQVSKVLAYNRCIYGTSISVVLI
ncbi:Egg cell-secreted protein 1.4 [Citrus sinensis]|nr:Egg cell-secreted protein 1.4 [Citrus sinensis]